jgi:predicted RNase H-like HicB family nuclease
VEGYTIRCLELPGAISQGETKEEALANIKKAVGLALVVLGQDLTAPSNAEILKVELVDVC